MNTDKWTCEDIETSIKTNLDSSYGNAITIGALFKKLYGFYPKIGLSGHQASGIDLLVEKLPNSLNKDNKNENN